MVLTKTDQQFGKEKGREAIRARYRYTELTGLKWPAYNYSLGYENAQEWYDALCKAIENAEKQSNTEK